jgi:hypothetical protein
MGGAELDEEAEMVERPEVDLEMEVEEDEGFEKVGRGKDRWPDGF